MKLVTQWFIAVVLAVSLSGDAVSWPVHAVPCGAGSLLFGDGCSDILTTGSVQLTAN